jgi:hypothetical protein
MGRRFAVVNATNSAMAAIHTICKLQNLIDEGDAQQKQIGRYGMDLIAERLTSLGLLDELISRAAWQLTSE